MIGPLYRMHDGGDSALEQPRAHDNVAAVTQCMTKHGQL